MTVGVILQPTYLPWLGYFDMVDQANVYIILDDVQFSRRSWQQRNRIKTDRGSVLLTCPCITKSLRQQEIKDVRLDINTYINFDVTVPEEWVDPWIHDRFEIYDDDEFEMICKHPSFFAKKLSRLAETVKIHPF